MRCDPELRKSGRRCQDRLPANIRLRRRNGGPRTSHAVSGLPYPGDRLAGPSRYFTPGGRPDRRSGRVGRGPVMIVARPSMAVGRAGRRGRFRTRGNPPRLSSSTRAGTREGLLYDLERVGRARGTPDAGFQIGDRDVPRGCCRRPGSSDGRPRSRRARGRSSARWRAAVAACSSPAHPGSARRRWSTTAPGRHGECRVVRRRQVRPVPAGHRVRRRPSGVLRRAQAPPGRAGGRAGPGPRAHPRGAGAERGG
jgi:hypothetical protein